MPPDLKHQLGKALRIEPYFTIKIVLFFRPTPLGPLHPNHDVVGR